MPYMPLILNGTRIQGNVVAPRAIQNKMLEFAAVHNLKPRIDKFPSTKEEIEKAFEHLDHGEMRYRGVWLPSEGA